MSNRNLLRSASAVVLLVICLLSWHFAVKHESESTIAAYPEQVATTHQPPESELLVGRSSLPPVAEVTPQSDIESPNQANPAPSVPPPLDSIGLEGLLTMESTISGELASAKSAALYGEWIGGVIHQVPGELNSRGELAFKLKATDGDIFREYRMHHTGVESICAEVRLEPNLHPEIYQMKADLDGVRNALREHGISRGLEDLFPMVKQDRSSHTLSPF
jgi:hypothetical protein